MPNRILKESICTSDNLNELNPQEEIFFYRLIVNCDDFGIFDARTKILRSKCFPLKTDTIKESDIEKWLKGLIKANLCFLYEVDGKRYLKMTSWERHQQMRATRSKYPTPDSDGCKIISIDSNGNQMISDDYKCPRNPIQSESESESNPNTSRASAFDAFWSAYPKKVGKGAAEKAFSKLSPALLPQMLSAIDTQKKSDQWKKDGGQFIPNPATWLNQRRWEDELTKPSGGFAYNTDFEEGTSL